MKKIIGLGIAVAVIIALVTTGTLALFSDTETSENNIFTAGTIDIAVNAENPWQGEGYFTWADMKPCKYYEKSFTLKNVGSNPCKVWKHLEVVEQTGGSYAYWGDADRGASSEPEYVEGGGEFDGSGNPTGVGYVERCNLAAYIIYDLYVDAVALIEETDYVRIDNIACTWIYLGEMAVNDEWVVKQSYHLRSWPDAAEPEVTNWAQGDTIKFNVELYAEQIGGTGPVGTSGSMLMENKDPVTWAIISDGISGTLNYNTSGSTFDYSFSGVAPVNNAAYELIYYVDPWPGTGGCSIGTGSSDGSGIISFAGTPELNMDLVNAKIWLVLDADYDGTSMTAWNPTSYLFETNVINYDDTDI